MGLRINDIAPDFTTDSTAGTVSLHDWMGDSYAILFSHPKDFTPVCTTEFMTFASMHDEFKAMNTELVGLSIDSL
ncbi:MAG TPA: redoxin domain-containing protein, partial [Pseudomonadaceae bacterium]|nr:redoxin domain-containing protein [Pseudomonadaceae bacterium]